MFSNIWNGIKAVGLLIFLLGLALFVGIKSKQWKATETKLKELKDAKQKAKDEITATPASSIVDANNANRARDAYVDAATKRASDDVRDKSAKRIRGLFDD